jgi:hypothetical protein
MTRFFLILTLCAAPVFAAQDASPATPAAPTAAAKKEPPLMPRLTIPKDAKPNGDGSFDYTDEQGKQWVYRNSPFGVVRITAEEAHKPVAPPLPSQMSKVTDLGDSVRFDVPTPLGNRVVVKKKSELTDQEQAYVKARLADQAAAAHTENHE